MLGAEAVTLLGVSAIPLPVPNPGFMKFPRDSYFVVEFISYMQTVHSIRGHQPQVHLDHYLLRSNEESHCAAVPFGCRSVIFCCFWYLNDLLYCDGSLPPKYHPLVRFVWAAWVWGRSSQGQAVSGLSCCLSVNCFWLCAAEPPGWEDLLESILIASSSDPGQARMGLEAKAGILFQCFLGTVS